MDLMRQSEEGSNENEVELYQMCRMCACKVDKGIPIFDNEGAQHDLGLKIKTHLPVQVSDCDSLPLQLCYDCTSILIQWDAAFLGCIAADRKLRALQWKQQQHYLRKESKDENHVRSITVETSQPSVAVHASGESLSCSICNRSGMGFRQLVSHLKNHDPIISSDGVNMKQMNSTDHLYSLDINQTSNHSEDQLSSQPYDCLGDGGSKSKPITMKNIRGKKGKCIADDSQENTTAAMSPNSEGMKSRLRKRKCKGLDIVDADKDSHTESGSGDPQVTSSTGTPPLKNANGCITPSSSSIKGCFKITNMSPSNKAEEMLKSLTRKVIPQNKIQEQPSKPKVRIISAETINMTLEMRAKANLNTKASEPNAGENGSSVPPQKLTASAPNVVNKQLISNKNKIYLPKELVKKISDAKSKPGPKLLRLKDGRIVRLLDSAQMIASYPTSQKTIIGSISATKPKVSLHIESILQSTIVRSAGQPISTTETKGATSVSHSNAMSAQGFISRGSNNPVSSPVQGSTIRRVLDATLPSVQDASGSSPEQTMNSGRVKSPLPEKVKGTSNKGGTCDKKKESSNRAPEPDKPHGPVKLEQSEVSDSSQSCQKRSMVNISFHPQPGPKTSTPRFTCFQCGKRNLLHSALHAHAQLHAPDKAILNAVSLPRTVSPEVVSSIIRLVSDEFGSKIT